jgi:hypothetical protein
VFWDALARRAFYIFALTGIRSGAIDPRFSVLHKMPVISGGRDLLPLIPRRIGQSQTGLVD